MNTKFFGILSWLFLFVGLLALLVGFLVKDPAWIVVALSNFILCYAWSLVDRLNDEVEKLKSPQPEEDQ